MPPLQIQLRKRVVPKHLCLSDVASKHIDAGMARLLLNRPFGSPGNRRGGGKAGPKRVARKQRNSFSNLLAVLLDDLGDDAITEARGPRPAELRDSAKEGPGRDLSLGNPLAKRPHRAGQRIFAVRNPDLPALTLLVGLAFSDHEHEAFIGFGEVFDIEVDEIAPAKRSAKADEQDSLVTQPCQGRGAVSEHRLEVVNQHRVLPAGRGTEIASKPPHGVSHNPFAGRRQMAVSSMSLGDSRHPALHRRDLEPKLLRTIPKIEREIVGRTGSGQRFLFLHQARKCFQSAR